MTFYNQLLKSILIGLALTIAPVSFAEEAEEPEVIIKQEDDKVIYEYRVQGVLKGIKIVPKNGAPYYLVPEDGGDFVRIDDPEMLVPQWTIFSWK